MVFVLISVDPPLVLLAIFFGYAVSGAGSWVLLRRQGIQPFKPLQVASDVPESASAKD